MDRPDYKPFIRTAAVEESTFGWLRTHFIVIIPVVNLFVLIYWCMSSRTSENKRRYALSLLLLFGILGLALYSAWRLESVKNFVEGPVRDRLVELVEERESVPQTEKVPQTVSTRYRIFTDMNGREMEAKVQGFTGSKVVIKRRDGEIFESEFGRFSHEDRDYLIQTRGLMESKD